LWYRIISWELKIRQLLSEFLRSVIASLYSQRF